MTAGRAGGVKGLVFTDPGDCVPVYSASHPIDEHIGTQSRSLHAQNVIA